MRTKYCFVGCLILGTLSFVGCGNKEGTVIPKTTQESASQLEAAFTGNDQAQKNAAIAAAALRRREYEKAAAALNSFNQFEKVSYEQAIVVKNSMKMLQQELANRVQTDPKARAAWERIKANARD
jgi:hypothetical protein